MCYVHMCNVEEDLISGVNNYICARCRRIITAPWLSYTMRSRKEIARIPLIAEVVIFLDKFRANFRTKYVERGLTENEIVARLEEQAASDNFCLSALAVDTLVWLSNTSQVRCTQRVNHQTAAAA